MKSIASTELELVIPRLRKVSGPELLPRGSGADCIPVHHGGKPRILYMITRAERGGAQTHVLDLACSVRDEFDVAVATGEEGFLTHACRTHSIPVYVLSHLQRQVGPIADILAFRETRQLIQDLQPDLIHAHTSKAGFLGRLAGRVMGVPSIYTMHTWLFGTAALSRIWGVWERPASGWLQAGATG
jgi:hypothetical protein